MQNPGTLFKIFPPRPQIFKSSEGHFLDFFPTGKILFLQFIVIQILTKGRSL